LIWLFGPSGSDKTYGAESIHNEIYPDEHGRLDIFDASKDTKWFLRFVQLL
jgi:hypothetical protein